MSARPLVAHARPTEASADAKHMDRALALAARGWGRVQPNPLVGAVVVDASGNVVGEGWHAAWGATHAEAEALERAGPSARGGTLYVTLEPCNHQGNTPPCTAAVLRSGVARVVVGMRDPNPVAAGGLERLEASGVEVVVSVREREASDQNAAFLHWHRTGRPFVALKYGMSLDARLGAATDRASEVTGPEAHAEVQRLRAGFDAILVGSRTALIDDPRLTVRGEVKPRRPPIRVVVDSEAGVQPSSRLAEDLDRAPSWVFCAPDAAGNASALEARGVRVTRARRSPGGGLDLDDVMQQLAAADVRSVLCEGGGRLGSALLSADRVARLYVFVAPVLLGVEGPPAFASVAGAAPGHRWRTVRAARFGSDTLLELARD